MKMFKKKKRGRWQAVFVILFTLVLTFASCFYYLSYKEKSFRKKIEQALNKNNKSEISDNFDFKNLEYVDFAKEDILKNQVATYLIEKQGFNNVNLVVFLDNTERQGSNLYSFYFQVNSSKNDVFKGFYEQDDASFEFNISSIDDIEDIEEKGGVLIDDSLAEKYDTTKSLKLLKVGKLEEGLKSEKLKSSEIKHIEKTISYYVALNEFNQDSFSSVLNFNKILENSNIKEVNNSIAFSVISDRGTLYYVYYFEKEGIVEVYDSLN